MKIAIVAVEVSADIQAAHLIRSLQDKFEDLSFFGAGGHRCRALGMELFVDSDSWSSIGPSQILTRLPEAYRLFWDFQKALLDWSPDLVVMLDSPAVNMRLGRFLKKHGVRSLYYFPPSAWTDKESRLKEICRITDCVIPVFRSNYEKYQEYGLETVFLGHPFMDLYQPLGSPLQAQQMLGLEERNYIALLPGSRSQEVEKLLPYYIPIAKAFRERHPEFGFLLPLASQDLAKYLGVLPDWVQVIDGNPSLVTEASRALLCCSGSATLQAACLDTPMIICYDLSPLDKLLGLCLFEMGLIRFGHIGLPNLVGQELGVPEYFAGDLGCRNLLPMLELLALDTPQREQQKKFLFHVRSMLGESRGVGQRLASFVGHFAQGYSREDSFARIASDSLLR